MGGLVGVGGGVWGVIWQLWHSPLSLNSECVHVTFDIPPWKGSLETEERGVSDAPLLRCAAALSAKQQVALRHSSQVDSFSSGQVLGGSCIDP